MGEGSSQRVGPGNDEAALNPLTTDDIFSSNFGPVLSVGTICFKQGEIEGGRWVSAWGHVCMAANLAGCRTALVSTGWTIVSLG